MRNTKAPSSLYGLTIVGREEDPNDPYERDAEGEIVVENDEQVLKDGWEYDENDKPVKVEDPDNEDEPKTDLEKLQDRADALDKALREERQLRRKAEREARKNKTKKVTETKQAEDKELQQQLETAKSRTEKLARGFLDSAIEKAVTDEARKQKFIDPTDALIKDVLGNIDADQDDDDPTDIDIDMDSVHDAVKDLADRKKHLVGDGTPGTPSGSRFRKSSREKNSTDAEKQMLEQNYPSLR